MSKNFHKGHRERVRKRFIEYGLDSFDEHQVLELLLFYCVPMRDTNELAHKILNEFGSLANLFDTDPKVISKRCNVSINTAVLISMIPALARRYYTSKYLTDKPILNSTRKIGKFSVALMTGRIIEHFFIICLNAQRKLLEAVLISDGTIDETAIYPRRIVEAALKYQTTSIVLVHNHPSGSFYPSQSDIESTKKIIKALEPINIEVLDHIIVAGDNYYSFVERNILFGCEEK